jgi:uncharacterized protein (DUF433 family)
MGKEERITINPDICLGKPCIKGTRIYITLILELLEAGLSFEEIIVEYPHLTKGDIVAAIRYARELVEKQTNASMFKELKGILPDSTLELYYNEKRKELEREEAKAPLRKNDKK